MNRPFRLFLFLLGIAALLPLPAQVDLESGMVTTASGLKYRVLHRGDGPRVEPGKKIGLHGIGSFPDGKVFWNSRTEGEPFYFVWGQDRVIEGCKEGTALMRVGDRFLFVMSPELGYGAKGKGDLIPPNATLVFDYEIVSVEEP